MKASKWLVLENERVMKNRLIKPSDRIFVAGARGMAGSAIVRALQRSGYGNPAQGGGLLTPTREELDEQPKAGCGCARCSHRGGY